MEDAKKPAVVSDVEVSEADLEEISNDAVRAAVGDALRASKSRASKAVGGEHRSGHGSVWINRDPDPDLESEEK